MAAAPFDVLRSQARRYAPSAHVPFSGEAAAAGLLLSDGAWVPGVRVESAAFSLSIPPLLNAYTTAAALGRTDVRAAALNRPMRPSERAFLDALPSGPFRPVGEDACAAEGASLPAPNEPVDPFLSDGSPGSPALPGSPAEGIALARAAAERAVAPFSHFPVGCVLAVAGKRVPGANIEHPDWMHILCAERTALSTACTYGLLGPSAEANDETGSDDAVLYLSCPNDPAGSPCGACRQLLVELLPQAVLWMDRASGDPERTQPRSLLPGSFRGTALSRSSRCDVPSA